MEVQDIRDALVIRECGMFLLTDMAGEVPEGNHGGYGLYHGDTRYLSTFEMMLPAGRPIVLLSAAELGYSSEHVLTNRTMTDLAGRKIQRSTIEVHRTRVLEDIMEETAQITNYNDFAVDLELVYRFAADFADIFVVRGYQPEHQGKRHPPDWKHDAIRLAYEGTDGHTRQTVLTFTPRPASVETNDETATVAFRVSLGPRQHSGIRIVATLDGRLKSARSAPRVARVAREYEVWLRGATRIESDNAFFDTVMRRSLCDIRMLWNHDRGTGGYPAAGTPWFDTLFGRDTCVVGLQTLSLKPDIARHCLATLARWQGTKFDPWRDEEPGKILHELRSGEMTQSGELPFSPYYGSIDSTPLFLLLAGEYFRWTNDIELLSHMETSIRAGLHWLEEYGDRNADGYVDYEKRSNRGLVNQGWKDSEDSLMHSDGTLLQPPITLVEVQAYIYAALAGLAPVFTALGDGETAAELRGKAEALQERFNRDFWLDGRFYALALDGEGQPSATVTSNAGHALWAGIATREQGRRVVRRLMESDMFSGWGIRTLSAGAPRFNPQGYHVGTVWPHDNSLIAMGFKRYGAERELNNLATALFEAAKAFPYYRLPELFGGTRRSARHSPVPYPVACRPQAWAAGAFPLITQAILGLCPDAPNKRLHVVRPVLPGWLRHVRVTGLRVGEAEVNLLYERYGERTDVQVLHVRGNLEVDVLDDWPAGCRP